MSASSPSLKNPVLIGAIVLGGIAVTILNINTFGPGQRPTKRVQASVQNQPSLPPDLALLVKEAMSGGELTPTNGATRRKSVSGPARDPFQSKVQLQPAIRDEEPQAETQEISELVCSAIMTGGKRPGALINGKYYAPGDSIRDYTLAAISNQGVTLQTHLGQEKFLPLVVRGQVSGKLIMNVEANQIVPERNLP